MIQIGAWKFPTKKAAEQHIRDLFWRYPPMGALTGEDLTFALAVIDLHPSRAIIVGCGIRTIHVQPVPFNENTQRRFMVIRTDQSPFDFSWRNALSPKSAPQKLAGVLRHLIVDQKTEFKRQHFRSVCETCGASIKESQCEVDHAYPDTFEDLTKNWLQSERLTAYDITIEPGTRYQEHSRLQDQALAESWVEYHRINARLRCVCRPCNGSTLRKASPGKGFPCGSSTS